MTVATKDLDYHLLQKHEKVPQLANLDLYLWDSDPEPIFMPFNDHITFYETNQNERKIIQILRYVLKTEMPPEVDRVVVDMGINDGYMSSLSAAYGHYVVSVDAQPECVRLFEFARVINGWKNVEVHNKLVLSEPKKMHIPNGVCGGGSRFQGKEPLINTDRGSKSLDITGSTEVSSTTVDLLVPTKTVVFFHLDVEGAELSVLQSASQVLSEKRLIHLVWEFAPHRWAAERDASLALVEKLMSSFTCLDVRSVSLPVESFPENESEVIKDWYTFYEELELKKVITDLWCLHRM